MGYFNGQKVFITGGSSGIGLAAARQLIEAGAHVSIAARGEKRLDEALETLRANAHSGQKLHRIALDIGDRDQVTKAVPEVIDALGGLDIVMNNAGIAHPAVLNETPDDIFESMMRVNYFGTVNVTRAFLPHLRAQNRGHIINVSSILGFMGIYGYTAYAASKHAVVGFSDCLRQELLGTAIGLTVVFPPDTDTPQLHAENLIKPPETKAIAGTVDMMSADDVAECMLKAVERGQYQVVPGAMGKLTHFAYRYTPWLVRAIADSSLKKYRRKNPAHTEKGV